MNSHDLALVIAALIAALVPSLFSLRNNRKLNQIHIDVNGKMEAFINEARKLARLEGETAERAREDAAQALEYPVVTAPVIVLPKEK